VCYVQQLQSLTASDGSPNLSVKFNGIALHTEYHPALKKRHRRCVRWCTPEIPGNWEAEAGGGLSSGLIWAKSARPYLRNKIQKDWSRGSVADGLPSYARGLGFNLQHDQKNKSSDPGGEK
jgi:hypothetical protein